MSLVFYFYCRVVLVWGQLFSIAIRVIITSIHFNILTTWHVLKSLSLSAVD